MWLIQPIQDRLYYLDWLRALVIFAAFIGHVMLPLQRQALAQSWR